MTYPINYAAEKRASEKRTARLLDEAKRELDRVTALHKPNRGRPKTPSIRNRMILRAYLSDVPAETLALRYDLTASDIERIVASERRKLEADDAKAIQADTEKRQAVAAQIEERRLARPKNAGKPTMIARDRAMARAFAKGTSTKELADQYGIGRKAVTVAIQRARRAGEHVPDGRLRSRRQFVERDRAIYEAAEAGTKLKALAAEHGISVAWIDGILARERQLVAAQADAGRAA